MLLLSGRIKAEVTGSPGVQSYFFYVLLPSKVCPIPVVIVHLLRETETEHVGQGDLNVGGN